MIKNLLTESLIPHPQNPRKELGDLKELANSIKANGVYQNLTVVDNYDGTYTIIIGHRRHAAAKLAGVKELPCAVVDLDEKQQLETMLLENMQRSDLTVYEQAQGFQLLIDLGSSVKEVAKETGFSESTIYKRTKLLELDRKLFEKSQAKNIPLEEYAKLNKLSKAENKNAALKVIGTNNFNDTLLKLAKQEKEEAAYAKIREFLDSFAEHVNNNSLVGYLYHKYYSVSSVNNLIVPEDAKPGKYLYTGSGPFALYRKGKNSRKSAEEREREKKQAEFTEEAKKIDGRVRELIHDFVKNYRSKFNSTFIELFKLYAKNHILAVDGRYAISNADISKLGKLYGVQVSKTYPISVTEADADEMCEDFIRLILSVFYSNLPEYGFLCANSSGKHALTRYIELMYEALKICGYEMSDEEREYFDGTHEIFAIMGEK